MRGLLKKYNDMGNNSKGCQVFRVYRVVLSKADWTPVIWLRLCFGTGSLQLGNFLSITLRESKMEFKWEMICSYTNSICNNKILSKCVAMYSATKNKYNTKES